MTPLEIKYYRIYNKSTQNELNTHFITACSIGNFEKVQFLLSSPHIDNHANIHAMEDNGIRMACAYGKLEVVQYLLTSSELKEHANVHTNNDACFKGACENGQMEIVEFLIFNCNIEKTENIKNFLQSEKFTHISEMFDKRKIFQDLNKELPSHHEKHDVKRLKL